MKTLFLLSFLSLVSTAAFSQSGPVGFCNYYDGIDGITGGMGGQVVRVTTRTELSQALSDNTPRIVLLEGELTGKGLDRTKDVIEVGSNKTLIGVGTDATLAGIGLNINGKENIIIRNLTIHHADPDGIACRNTHHVWVDHCNVYSQDEADKEDWDGLIDLTVGSTYLTVSYCYIHDHHKACLLNSGTQHFEDNGKNRATYHHNAFVRTDQRNPRIGYGLGHVFCNYYEKIGAYCIGGHTQAQVYSENNYFSSSANHPFEQMYAGSLDDASCAFFSDQGSYFAKGQETDFKHGVTGTTFNPSTWYEYAFLVDDPAVVPDLYPAQVGPVAGIENEAILWPGNGASDMPLDIVPRWSNIENEVSSCMLLGPDPESLEQCQPEALALQPSTTYYWQVETKTADDATYLSPLYRFTTASEKASHPSPYDGDECAQLRVATAELAATGPMPLFWRRAALADHYEVWLWDETGEAILSGKTTSATTIQPGTLAYGQTYQWRVDVVTKLGERIEGDLWSFSTPLCPIIEGKTEMEHLCRSAYAYLEREDGSWFKASNDSVTVGEAGPGAMTGVFAGTAGEYSMSVTFYDEKAGQAWMGVSINDQQVDSWKGSKVYQMTTHEISNTVHLEPGDQIRVDFYTQSKMRCRIDCLELTLIPSGIVQLENDTSTPSRSYNLLGQPVMGVAKGFYIDPVSRRIQVNKE